jgi:metal-sulfur cluster biosynthetic enzyme
MAMTTETINRDTSVREAIARYPGAEAIFEEYGLGGCGGPDGPQEPIGFFAAIHHVDPDALVESLNQYARAQGSQPTQHVAPDAPRQPYRLFLSTALVLTLFGGITSGVAAAITGGGWGGLRGESWLALVQTHGHIQLFGFMVLFIVGVAYHVLPRFKQQQPLPEPLVYGTYGLLAGGVLLRALTQPHAQGWLRGPFVAGSMLEFAGALLFATVLMRVLRSQALRESLDYYVMAAAFALVGVTGMNIYLSLDAVDEGRRIFSAIGNDALLIGTAQGFVVLFVLGISTRVAPFFLSLRPPRGDVVRWSAIALAIAIPLRVLAEFAPEVTSVDVVAFERAGTFGAAAAILAAVWALRVFESPTTYEESPQAPPSFSIAVRVAFAWLIGAVALDSYWQLREIDGGVTPMYAAGAIRHAYLLGFGTMMMMAMGYRTVPVFSGRALPWRAGVSASFAMVGTAAVLRVLPVAFALAPSDLDFKLMAAGGVLLFAGVAIFAWELGASMFGWKAPRISLKFSVRWGDDAPVMSSSAPVTAAPVLTATPPPAARPAPVAEATANGASANGAAAPGPIVASMTVAEALAVHPSVLGLLIDRGFGPLATPDTRARMAPITTIERAASFVGATPEDLVAYRNEGIARETDDGHTSNGDATGGADGMTMTMMDTSVSKQAVTQALESCYDPEVPVNIVDLGLVFDVLVRGDYARVTMGMTSPGCPAADMLEADVRKALKAVDGIDTIDVEVVEEPAWTPARMSMAARQRLGMA